MTTTFYGEDLAWVHHDGFAAVPTAAARYLLAYLRRHRVPEGAILDLGCGSGRFAAAVAASGRPVIGMDISSACLDLARTQASEATLLQGSLFDAKLPDAAVITLIGEGLNYVPSHGRMPALGATLRRLHGALAPDGLLLFDVITGPRERLVPAIGHRAGADWVVLFANRALRARDRFERRITVFRQRDDGLWRRSEEVHRVRVYDRRAVSDGLRRLGFRVRTAAGYAAASQLPGRTLFIARKRA